MRRAGFLGFIFCLLTFNLHAHESEPEAVGYLREKFNSADWQNEEPDLVIFSEMEPLTTADGRPFFLPRIWLRLENGSYLPLSQLNNASLYRRLNLEGSVPRLELLQQGLSQKFPNILGTILSQNIVFELGHIETAKEISSKETKSSDTPDIDPKDLTLISSMTLGISNQAALESGWWLKNRVPETVKSIVEPLHILTTTFLDGSKSPKVFRPSSLPGVAAARDRILTDLLSWVAKNSQHVNFTHLNLSVYAEEIFSKSGSDLDSAILEGIYHAFEKIQWPQYRGCAGGIAALAFTTL